MPTHSAPLLLASLQNQRIKDVIKLNKRAARDQRRVTVVEGWREATRALAAGIVPVEAFLCADLLGENFAPVLHQIYASGIQPASVFNTTPAVFAKLAYRGESGGILLVVPYFSRRLTELHLTATPLLLVIEGAEKPGNLGAILRTADAVGVDAVILVENTHDDATDLHNPNTIRAALGATFTVPVAAASATATREFLNAHAVRTVATTPDATVTYWDADLRGPLAILLGSEAHGLSDPWLATAHVQVQMPMHGAMDSLNLATATAVMLYESLRQRSRPTLPPPDPT
ncbi:MAG: TrmH family RNA methyltransferase [Litorilinea sp.]